MSKKIVFVCQCCGDEFEVYPSRLKKGTPKYCSSECKYEHMKVRETQNRKKVKCSCCGKEFLVYNNRIKSKKTDDLFCSHECYDEFRKKRVMSVCECCGKEFEVKESVKNKGYARFCSWECRTNILVGKEHPSFTGSEEVCLNCGKSFLVKKSQKDKGAGKYCSLECKYEADRIFEQNGGKFYSLAIWREIRKKCYERDNNSCTQCGSSENLHAHHIIPRRAGGVDELENLVTLCAKCHGKIKHIKIIKEILSEH